MHLYNHVDFLFFFFFLFFSPGLPFLETEPAPIYDLLRVSDVMAAPVKCLPSQVSVRNLADLLANCTHNGFPVVDADDGGVFLGYRKG